MTGCHEDIHHHISVLTDKSLYSAQMCQNETAPEWDVIKRVKDIPTVPSTLNSKPTPGGRRIDVTSVPLHWAYNPVHTVCNDFERNIIITIGETEHDYSFFNCDMSKIKLPLTNAKYKPHKKIPKGVLYYLQDDYNESNTESEEDCSENRISSLI